MDLLMGVDDDDAAMINVNLGGGVEEIYSEKYKSLGC